MSKKRVTEPAIRVQHDKHSTDRLFVLSNKDEWMTRPDNGTRLQGPAMVLVQEVGLKVKVYVYPCLRDARPWAWLGRLAKAGAWALNGSVAADMLPDELVAASPRFKETSSTYRKKVAESARKSAKYKKSKR